MTEKTVESGQDQGAVELPKPSYQDKPAAEQTSPAAQSSATPDIQAIVDAAVEKAVQSTKDKRFDKIERNYGDLKEIEQMLTAVKGGQDPKELLEALELKNLREEIAQIKQAVSQPQVIPGKDKATEAYEKAKDIISKAGLSNNPRILEAMGNTYADLSEMLTEVNLTVMGELTGKPRATDASKVTPSSSQAPMTSQQGVQEFDSLLSPNDESGIDLNSIINAARNIKE